MTHRRRHPLIWLALVAMLAVALLPTVSHALAHARGGAAAWAAVCTPQGLRSVVLAPTATGRDAAPSPAAVRPEHCPLCTLAADHPGLPAAAVWAGVSLPFHTVRLAPASEVHRGRAGWAIAQARGPPVAA